MGEQLDIGQPIRVIKDSGKELVEGTVESLDLVKNIVTVKDAEGNLHEFSGDSHANHGFYKPWGGKG